uniref:Major facilitator superfamily associated domain-containing protein n=1 Tax=Timema douglasi TaxID=61478 RepID=A0A7R8VJH5_TIMDO|nr:unnamed protein product [Timema douglasi]
MLQLKIAECRFDASCLFSSANTRHTATQEQQFPLPLLSPLPLSSFVTRLININNNPLQWPRGLGCLLPFLPLHMLHVGLTPYEARVISCVAPLVAILGPLVVSPLADRLGGSGRPIRAMLALCMFLSAVFFCLLMSIPTVRRIQPRLPSVSFTCNPQGASVLQERCMEPQCHQWTQEMVGSLQLSKCRYDCSSSASQPRTQPHQDEDKDYSNDTSPSFATTMETPGYSDSWDDTEGSAGGDVGGPIEVDDDYTNTRDQEIASSGDDTGGGLKRHRRDTQLQDPCLNTSDPILCPSDIASPETNPPHLCFKVSDHVMCNVFTADTPGLTINASLSQTDNLEDGPEDWCRYPLSEDFLCHIPANLVAAGNSCRVVCDIKDPYNATRSVLAQSQCRQVEGDPDLTFWSYLLVNLPNIIVRSVADIFPTAALTLVSTATVIATRETSAGHGDIGHELAWGCLGLVVFPPLAGFLASEVTGQSPPVYYIVFSLFAVLMVLGTLVAVVATGMPVSPPDWWWHARGMPMTTLRRYGAEIGAVALVLVLMGAFWSALDSFLPWHLLELKGSELMIGVTLAVGALPAIPFLWWSEKVVDYCGHSNLLITAFTFYIIRYTGLSFITDPWWTLVCESFEVFTLSLMWVTAILYMRHLVPRHLTTTGQGIAVIAHFCIGRSLGALIGAVISSYSTEEHSLVMVYRVGAVVAAIVASVYFTVYHCCLKPRCLAPAGPGGMTPQTGAQGPTSNGTYTPLRVYHNGGRQQKGGQFRY